MSSNSSNAATLKRIETTHAPAAIGPYSQGMIANGLLYTSGQIAINPADGQVVEADISIQTKQVLENIDAILRAANTGPAKVIKTTWFLSDMAHFAAFNSIYGTYFTGKPARSCVAVRELPKSVLVEIEVIASL